MPPIPATLPSIGKVTLEVLASHGVTRAMDVWRAGEHGHAHVAGLGPGKWSIVWRWAVTHLDEHELSAAMHAICSPPEHYGREGATEDVHEAFGTTQALIVASGELHPATRTRLLSALDAWRDAALAHHAAHCVAALHRQLQDTCPPAESYGLDGGPAWPTRDYKRAKALIAESAYLDEATRASWLSHLDAWRDSAAAHAVANHTAALHRQLQDTCPPPESYGLHGDRAWPTRDYERAKALIAKSAHLDEATRSSWSWHLEAWRASAEAHFAPKEPRQRAEEAAREARRRAEAAARQDRERFENLWRDARGPAGCLLLFVAVGVVAAWAWNNLSGPACYILAASVAAAAGGKIRGKSGGKSRGTSSGKSRGR